MIAKSGALTVYINVFCETHTCRILNDKSSNTFSTTCGKPAAEGHSCISEMLQSISGVLRVFALYFRLEPLCLLSMAYAKGRTCVTRAV